MKLQPLMLLCLAASSCSFGEAKKGRQMDAKYGFVDDGLSSSARGTRKSAFISDGRRMDAKRGSGESANRLSSPKKGRLMSEHDWNKEPYGGLILGRGFTEVKFVNGTPHCDPPTHGSYPVANFFKQAPNTDITAIGYAESDAYPFYIWYEFQEPIVPGRFSFHGNTRGFCPTTWFFVGSNAERCGRYSTWTPLCGKVSESIWKSKKTPLFCHVKSSLAKPYRCLGIMVLESDLGKRGQIDVLNSKMWKVDPLPQDGHWPGKPYGQ